MWCTSNFRFALLCSHINESLQHFQKCKVTQDRRVTLQWRHYERDAVSNHQPHDCLINLLFKADQRKHKAPRHWPLWGEFPGYRWIPCTKGQQCGKCFHLMMSSWNIGVGRWGQGWGGVMFLCFLLYMGCYVIVEIPQIFCYLKWKPLI